MQPVGSTRRLGELMRRWGVSQRATTLLGLYGSPVRTAASNLRNDHLNQRASVEFPEKLNRSEHAHAKSIYIQRPARQGDSIEHRRCDLARSTFFAWAAIAAFGSLSRIDKPLLNLGG